MKEKFAPTEKKLRRKDGRSQLRRFNLGPLCKKKGKKKLQWMNLQRNSEKFLSDTPGRSERVSELVRVADT